MERINWALLCGRMRKKLGWQVAPEELGFRSHFYSASRSMDVHGIKVCLENTAWEVVDAFNRYASRKAGFEMAARVNEHAHLGLLIDDERCAREIRDLFMLADAQRQKLLDACRAAHQIKGAWVFENPVDNLSVGNRRLRRELIHAMQTLDNLRPNYS